MWLEQDGLILELHEKTGAIAVLQQDGISWIGAAQDDLFRVRFVGSDGRVCQLHSHEMAFSCDNVDQNSISLSYTHPRLSVRAAVRKCQNGFEWMMDVRNESDDWLEWIEYPCLSVPNALVGDGGAYSLFLPRCQGCIIEKAQHCQWAFPSYPNWADDALYPGMMAMQFMACLCKEHGLYFASHDTHGIPKNMLAVVEDESIRLIQSGYHAVAPGASYTLPYPVVTLSVGGDWEDSAEYYRQFVEQSDFPLPPKLADNANLPGWYHQSPIVVVYNARSIRGTDYSGPNEFFPYVNGVRYLNRLGKQLDSSILSLLAYWEGTAPWAPPFTWPPYGGAEGFVEYVERMHDAGHYVGVYGSGTAWTDDHFRFPDFTLRGVREAFGVDAYLCTGEDGAAQYSRTCDQIRNAYDMCLSTDFVQDLAMDQVRKVTDAGVDFFQFFDQHNGARIPICYAKNHGHPPVYGPWATRSLKKLLQRMQTHLASTGKQALVGVEAAPGDCFVEDFPMSDTRFQLSMKEGRAVPAYEYVFHAYANNFMGNQCGFETFVDLEQNPESLLFRIAFAFVAGNMLTVHMKSGGEIHWGWGLPWTIPAPEQEPLIRCLRNFNALRKGPGKPYLQYGTMLKKRAFSGAKPYIIQRMDGTQLIYEDVLASCWRAQDGSIAQIFASFSNEERTITLEKAASDGTQDSFVIPAYSAGMIRWEEGV